jgi:hypothetical protein
MAATLYPLLVPPRPWHTVGFDYLTKMPLSNGFDSVRIVIDHLTRMARFMPCATLLTKKLLFCFYKESADYMEYLA